MATLHCLLIYYTNFCNFFIFHSCLIVLRHIAWFDKGLNFRFICTFNVTVPFSSLLYLRLCPAISVVEEVQEDVTGSKVSVRSASKDNIKDNTEKVPYFVSS